MPRPANPLKGTPISESIGQWLLELGELTEPIDWAEVFGRQAPLEMEIGCGKGLFMVNSAQAHPETNFIGVEIARKYALYAASRLAKRSLANARMLAMDAGVLLTHGVAHGALRRVHVLFPDPWWKKRHRKRRVINPKLIAQCERVLEPGGEVHIATDVEPYFRDIQEMFAAHGVFEAHDAPPAPEPTHDMDYLTNYERRTRKADKPVYRIRYVRPI